MNSMQDYAERQRLIKQYAKDRYTKNKAELIKRLQSLVDQIAA